jgi:adenine-specific DNA-methyltransferase
MDDMKEELSKVGSFAMHPLGSVGRYRPNKVASKSASDVNEFLVIFEKSPIVSDIIEVEKFNGTKPVLLENYA